MAETSGSGIERNRLSRSFHNNYIFTRYLKQHVPYHVINDNTIITERSSQIVLFRQLRFYYRQLFICF
ncbi:hypothetical protein HanPSC8_Chr14g0631971 [Helianthus annuus]|nr:hypothetical protein HanPSC8_Chr14g0631971 [Helianthus annuus]